MGPLPALPVVGGSLLVRTDFSDDVVWRQVSAEAGAENEDGFAAHVTPISDAAFDGAGWQAVRSAVPVHARGASVLFIADRATFVSPDHPILVVDLRGHEPPFRCIPPCLWSVENNLNLANMDWNEFATALDANATFRGFD